MGFKDTTQDRIDYFRRSVRMDSKATESDPEYNDSYPDSELHATLEYSSQSLWGESITTLPISKFQLVLLKSKLEVYYRLATTTAPFYPLSAEGASLQKNERFEHYKDLIEEIRKLYDLEYSLQKGDNSGNEEEEEDPTGTGGVVTSYNVGLDYPGRHYKKRNESIVGKPKIELLEITLNEDTMNLEIEWTPYDYLTSNGFKEYRVYFSDKPIYDKYDDVILDESKLTTTIKDHERNFARFGPVEEGKEYYVLVESELTNGKVGRLHEGIFVTEKEVDEDDSNANESTGD